MDIVTTIPEVRAAVAAARVAGRSIGLVPTMGALHAGHASLVDAAAASCGLVVVSIFVNPTQFGPAEDLGAYPRTPEPDADLCRRHGAGLIFMPSVEEMYGRGGLTEVSIRKLGQGLCGARRPGHFTGVCTVVAKLFNIVLPDLAFFGAKDYQQATILRRMTADLNFPIEIVVCPTVREADGLAMSSRNVYLSPDERRQAPALQQALRAAADLIRAKHPPVGDVLAAIRARLAAAAPLGAEDYIHVVDPDELAAVETTDRPVVIALAVRFGKARLIDNILVDARRARP